MPPFLTARWKGGVTYGNYLATSISPTFAAPLGTYGPNKDPFWGPGNPGLLGYKVDDQANSTAFWQIVKQYSPIAIMSFSLWLNNFDWIVELFATNWARYVGAPPVPTYITSIPYTDTNGHGQTETWAKPFIGGGATDPSPLANTGAKPPYNPPDPSTNAGGRRNSNLPRNAMVAAINATFNNVGISAIANGPNDQGPGTFVSNFMAYHGIWYREYISAKFPNDPTQQCLYSGHTHAGGKVAVAIASQAAELQLGVLLKNLP